MSTLNPQSSSWVTATLTDGTEYVGPPLDEPCAECGAAAGEPCTSDDEEEN